MFAGAGALPVGQTRERQGIATTMSHMANAGGVGSGPLLGVLAFGELLPCFKQSLAVLYKTPWREMRRVSFF